MSSTYTLDMDFTKNSERGKVFFGYGTLVGKSSDKVVGLELHNTKGIRWMHEADKVTEGTDDKDGYFVKTHPYKENNTTKLRFVLSGSAASSGKVTVTVSVYSKNASGEDVFHGETTYTTASGNAYIYLGLGEWNAITSGKSYSMSNVNIYKGDISGRIDFESRYNNAGFGATLLNLDISGLKDSANSNKGGYNWTDVGSTTVDGSNIVVNKTTSGAQGFYTTLPIGNQWDYGYYTLEFNVNSNKGLAVHVFNATGASRIGFGLGGNTEKGTTEDLNWLGQDFGQDQYMANLNATDNQGYNKLTETGMKLSVYNANAQRVQLGSRANVRIEFNGFAKTVTLYEKTNDKTTASDGWIKVSAMDYSELKSGVTLTPIFSVHVYDADANVVIKNVKWIKGLAASHLIKYESAGFDPTFITKQQRQTLRALRMRIRLTSVSTQLRLRAGLPTEVPRL